MKLKKLGTALLIIGFLGLYGMGTDRPDLALPAFLIAVAILLVLQVIDWVMERRSR